MCLKGERQSGKKTVEEVVLSLGERAPEGIH
jgi:hypothetical protein